MSEVVVPFPREQAVQAHEYPPSLVNTGTEAALIAALMHAGEGADALLDRAAPEDFHDPLMAHLYALIRDELAAGRSISPPALIRHLQGGMFGLTEAEVRTTFTGLATASSVTLVGAKSFAAEIVDLAKRRRLYDQMRATMAAMAIDTQSTVETLVEGLDTAMASALQRQTTTRSATVAQAFDRTLKAIEDEAAGKGPQGIRIAGLEDFNSLTGDLRRGNLMYLGGRPSMGKTALSIELALGAARAGFGTLFISLEMQIEELTTRAISGLIFDPGNSPTFDSVRRGRFGAFDRERLAQARKLIDEWPLILTDPSHLNIGQLAMMIRRYQRQMAAKGQTLDLVVVDYLGLIHGPKSVKRYEEVGAISRALKAIAKECDVALVVLAQLSRKCEEREDKRPMLSDLRDAGDIEQDADHVMFVYRDQYYLERSEPDRDDTKTRPAWEEAMGFARDRMEIIAAKVRQGEVGKRVLYFFGAHQAVRNSTFYKDLEAERSQSR